MLPKVNGPIIYSGEKVSDDKSCDKPVGQADQAADETDIIADKKLPEQRQMRADNLPFLRLKQQPIGSDEDGEADYDAENNASDRCIEPHDSSPYDLFQSV